MGVNMGKYQYNRYLRGAARKVLIDRQGGKCHYCGVDLLHKWNSCTSNENNDRWAWVDHKVPWCVGGKTDLENCVMACRKCNLQKKGESYENFTLVS